MTIKIEDLTPGTVVELRPVTVERVRVDRFVDFVAGDGQRGAASLYNIARIISRPETDADKIARLERELAAAQNTHKTAVDCWIADVARLRQELKKKQDLLTRALNAGAEVTAELAERDARIAELLKAANPLHVVEAAPAPEAYPTKITHIQEQVTRLQDQIDGMVATLTTRPNPLIGEPTCYESDVIDGTTSPAPEVLGAGVVSQFCAGIEPTTRVWSDPIEGPPNPKLPLSAVQVCYVKDANGTCAGAPWFKADGVDPVTVMFHRILMHQPITWEGGERPVPGDWVVVPVFNSTEMGSGGPAGGYCWERDGFPSDITSFTLTSTGGGNG